MAPPACANDQVCHSVADHRPDRRKRALSDLLFTATLRAEEAGRYVISRCSHRKIRPRKKKVPAAAIISAHLGPRLRLKVVK